MLTPSAHPVRSSLLQTVRILLFLAAITGRCLAAEALHPVTVADAIEMTKVSYQGDSGRVATFSPDGSQVVVVIRKGNLATNTNEYSMLLWHTSGLFSASPERPITLASLSSSSNREGIKNVVWQDSKTVLFLGNDGAGFQQLYACDVQTASLRQLTHTNSNVLSFDTPGSLDNIAYVATVPAEALFDNKTGREGLLIKPGESLANILSGKKVVRTFSNGLEPSDNSLGNALYFSDVSGVHHLPTVDPIPFWGPTPRVSPDGRYLVLTTQVQHVPRRWESYSNPLIREFIAYKDPTGKSLFRRYELIDTSTGHSRVLLDTPILPNQPVIAWSGDSHSIAIAGVYLTLDGATSDEYKARQSHTFVVEIAVPSCEVTVISQEAPDVIDGSQFRSLHWASGRELALNETRSDPRSGIAAMAETVFRKSGNQWTIEPAITGKRNETDIIVQEDMNTPPDLYALDRTTGRRSLMLELNRQFRNFHFARVEEVTWKGSDGHEVKGGLYYPLNYVPGHRYPLVIQTHAWDPSKFWIDGPFTTAFAAQPIAGHDIAVLQADEDYREFDTLTEMKREVSTFEGAIDYLDRRGLIDRRRVGIIGFSRTGMFVPWSLVHSPKRYNFAAASIADGSAMGYAQYFLTNTFDVDPWYKRVYGGLPFGKALKRWATLSPGMNLQKVHTPIRVVAIGPDLLLEEWEMYVALSCLKKPVEMVYLADGVHVLEKPWDRVVSQQGDVDWFRFWLKNEEDQDPSKADQYARWRDLRNQAAASQ